MKCREFKHSTASLSLSELAGVIDPQLLSHAEQCNSCGAWMRGQRTLASSVEALQSRTANCEAGGQVEEALVAAFRQSATRPALVTPAPVARSLWGSRWFAAGAYVAVAAAIIVGVFLGIRLRQHSASPAPVQSHNTRPSPQSPAMEAQMAPAGIETAAPRTAAAIAEVSAAEGSTVDPDGSFTPLMLCDPLSCSGDTQVVRVELPATGTTAQMADVVVGYDGVVRAVRIVN